MESTSASYRLPGCVGLMFEEELNLLNRLPAGWTDGLPETEGEQPAAAKSTNGLGCNLKVKYLDFDPFNKCAESPLGPPADCAEWGRATYTILSVIGKKKKKKKSHLELEDLIT